MPANPPDFDAQALQVWRDAIASRKPVSFIAAALAAAYQQGQQRKTCAWKADEDGIYQTGCGHEFSMESDPPHDWIKFCCYCGASAMLEEYVEPVLDDE